MGHLQQQGFSERINLLTREEKPFYQEHDQDQRDGGGSALGDTQYPTGQCPKQAALHDSTEHGAVLATSRDAFPPQELCHPVLGSHFRAR